MTNKEPIAIDNTERAFIDDRNGKLIIPNAHIFFRNFKGEESRYNREGNRNFCVNIEDPDLADILTNEGWNVKISKPRDDSEEPKHYIQVTVSYRFKSPKIVTFSGNVKTSLTEESVETLDYADILNVDLVINPSYWEDGGRNGIKAYLDTMYVRLEEDYFDYKYAESEFPDDDDLPF